MISVETIIRLYDYLWKYGKFKCFFKSISKRLIGFIFEYTKIYGFIEKLKQSVKKVILKYKKEKAINRLFGYRVIYYSINRYFFQYRIIISVIY